MNKVYYLGPIDSFSQIITKKVLDENLYSFLPCSSFLEISKKLESDKSALGVLPIENSITSDIHENIDFLFKKNVQIIKEAYLEIKLNLIGLSASKLPDIKTVYSHPRAILQCTDFIEKHNFQIAETISTSAGKDIILKNKNISEALIGSSEIAKGNEELRILKDDIGNYKFNRTRFVFISKETSFDMELKNKASVIFKVLHKPGSLAYILGEIAKRKLNITKIESRPIPNTNWEYHFWIDIESYKEALNPNIVDDIFKKMAVEYNILGFYHRGDIFES